MRTNANGRKGIRRMVIEPSDNGGFVSTIECYPPKHTPGVYVEGPETKNVHADVGSLLGHIKMALGSGKKRDGGARSGKTASPAPEWAGVADRMMEHA
jgi:hypothetical protein